MLLREARGRYVPRSLAGALCVCALAGVGVGSAFADGSAAPSYVTAKMAGRTDAAAGPTGPTGGAPETPAIPAMPRTTSDQVPDLLYRDAVTAVRLAKMIAALEPGAPREHVYDIAQSVARWTRVYGVRPELMVALIDHESRFDPMARSATNDHGLCQLHGRPIYEIDANVQAGVAHIAGNLAAAGGDEFRALCTYNGGSAGSGYSICQAYAREVLEVANGVYAQASSSTNIAMLGE